jgi:hypothetical protein|tara:strand:- start:1236 stop:4100 length:2865 start_codon:yes stop_codon:yes gene_type:complete
MASICKEKLLAALEEAGLKDKLDADFINDLFKDLDVNVKQANKDIANAQSILKKYREKLIGDTAEAEKIAVQNAINDLVVQNRLDVEMQLYDNPWEAIEAMTIGIVGSNKKGAAYSIDAVQKGILNTNLGRLINKLEGRDKKLASMKLLDEFKSGRFDSDIIREGYELRKMQDSETDAKNAIRPSGAGAKIGITGNKKAMAIAKILHETFMDMDYTSNRAGANIAKSEIGSFARPSYNRTKILTAGREEFVAYLKEEGVLNKERTFMGDSQEDNILRALYEAVQNNEPIISKGSRLDLGSGHFANSRNEAFKAFPGRNSTAKKATRKSTPYLVFEDAEAQIKFNKKFGSDSLIQNVMYDMESTSRNTGLMKRFGTRPREMLAHLENRAKNIAVRKMAVLDGIKDKRPLTRAEKKAYKRLFNGIRKVDKDSRESWMSVLDGTALRIEGGLPGQISLAGIGAATRALQTLTKLGSSTITAFSDIFYAGSALRAHSDLGAGESYFQGFANVLKGRGSPDQRQAVRSMGLGIDGLLGAVHSKFGAVDSAPGSATKLVGKFFKLNSMNWWNDSHRSGMIDILSRNFASHAKKSYAKLPEQMQRTLRTYDITEPEWEIYRKYGLNKYDGHAGSNKDVYMTNENFDQLLIEGTDGKKDLVKYAYDKQVESTVFKKGFDKPDKEISKTEYEQMYDALQDDPFAVGSILRDKVFDLKNKMNTMYTNLADSGVIMPGAYEKSLSIRLGSAGSYGGEFNRWIMQFKSFPVSVVRKVLKREIRLGMASGGAGGVAYNIAGLVAMTTTMGYASLATKDILMGKTPVSLFTKNGGFNMSYLTRSAIQGGAAGLYADFLLGEWNRYGSSALRSAAGPFLGQVDDVAAMGANVLTGDFDKAGRLLNRLFLSNFAIGGNLYYTRYAFNYLIAYEMQEFFNPGYTRRVEQRIMRDNEQKFYLTPSVSKGAPF